MISKNLFKKIKKLNPHLGPKSFVIDGFANFVIIKNSEGGTWESKNPECVPCIMICDDIGKIHYYAYKFFVK